jgi:DNA-binding transcriptional MocR family regulator
MTPTRAAELAAVLAEHETIVIEDDHSGAIAWAEPVSLGTWLPDRTVHIRSYSKSHGPDLRLAAVGGASQVLSELVERRILGPGWSSRLLQAVLLEMLRDPAAIATVDAARRTYHERRERLRVLLERGGVRTYGGDGINVWCDAAAEDDAVLRLRVDGIAVSPGRPFWLRGPAATPSGARGRTEAGNLRITISSLSDDEVDRVGHDIVRALST